MEILLILRIRHMQILYANPGFRIERLKPINILLHTVFLWNGLHHISTLAPPSKSSFKIPYRSVPKLQLKFPVI